MAKIYTKRGDKGNTSMFGGGEISKSNLRVEAYGAIDELNSLVGLLVSGVNDEELSTYLRGVQNNLFLIGSFLSDPENKIISEKEVSSLTADTKKLEEKIDIIQEDLPELKNFILPGGSKPASYSHLARSVCRRAERRIVSLNEKENVNKNILKYINRLSDYFFALARRLNSKEGVKDIVWSN